MNKIPEDIDGLGLYEIGQSGGAIKGKQRVRDGRRWQSAQTCWNGFDNVRYFDCSGPYKCINSICDFKKEYSVVSRIHFDKRTRICSVCGCAGKYIQCDARCYIALCGKKTWVYHNGKHTCPVLNIRSKESPKEEVNRHLRENPTSLPRKYKAIL